MVGGVVQLVLLFQELWRRSEESGETLSYPEVIFNIMVFTLKATGFNSPGPLSTSWLQSFSY